MFHRVFVCYAKSGFEHLVLFSPWQFTPELSHNEIIMDVMYPKTRSQIAEEYGMHMQTLRRKLKRAHVG
ncbi:MAG: hypothetical protein WBA17_11695 [Saprospiraceae bacterium]